MTLAKIGITFLLFLINFSALSQQEQIEGLYTRNIVVNNSGAITYSLSLANDNSFSFEYTRKIDANHSKEVTYCKGTWKLLNKTKIELTTNKELIGQKDVLDLTTSKAHFITKSPRDKTDRVVVTSLKFFDSYVPWVKGILLEKQ
jgi:hypothetical protein